MASTGFTTTRGRKWPQMAGQMPADARRALAAVCALHQRPSASSKGSKTASKTSGVTGLILAGGQSRRMGRDKAHLPWGSATLIARVIETLRPVTEELLVVARDARAFAGLGARVVEDLVPGAHALGGLYTGLTLAAHERCFVCACDNPFLSAPLVRFLYEQLDGGDLVIPKTASGLQPLHAAYARSALPAIQEQLRQERWDLCALAPKLRTRIIEPEQWRPFDHGGRSFFNLNTPADYAAARQLAAEGMRCATSESRRL